MQRHERLEQDIKVALSTIITYEVKEPEVSGMISVTDVKITPDQSTRCLEKGKRICKKFAC